MPERPELWAALREGAGTLPRSEPGSYRELRKGPFSALLGALPAGRPAVPGGDVAGLPLPVQMAGRAWLYLDRGFVPGVENYRTTGTPLAGPVQSARLAEFIRDRVEEQLERPQNGLVDALREAFLTLLEVYDQGIFDCALADGVLFLAYCQARPLLLRRDEDRLALLADREERLPGSLAFTVPRRARGRLILFLGPDFLYDENL